VPFLVKSRRASVEKLLAQHPGAIVVDVTSRGPEPWVRFSPFYPHGGIPVPFSPGRTAMSVEGIWQGLKVFEGADVDPATLQVATMKGIKRTVRTFGKVLGHRSGLAGDRLLPYAEARRVIYVPTYRWVLEHKLAAEIAALRQLRESGRTVLLLDYETNGDMDDLSRPLSHASLVARYLEEA
jgi:hypothetical protein